MRSLLPTCGQPVRTKAALSPDGLIPRRPAVKAAGLQEWVYSLYQLPPAQASLTHRPVTCLEWTGGQHPGEVIQRAVGQSSFAVNRGQVTPTHSAFRRRLFACEVRPF